MLQSVSLASAALGGYLSPQKHWFPPIVPATALPLALQSTDPHLSFELKVSVERNFSSPGSEKQPWTTGAPSIGADEGSSTPLLVAVAAPRAVVAANRAAAMIE